jgi:hypothetical protein
MKESARNLHAMLKRDFSVDLPIAGGMGHSADDPIIVTAADPLEAAAIETAVLCCIGKGRGVLWRTLARTSVERGGEWREQVKIETKQLMPTKIVIQRENYYFDVAVADPGHQGLPPAPSFIDPKTGLKLAHEIGWLHLEGVTDNEAATIGLSYSLAYGAAGMKATVFVYDRGLASITDRVDSEIPESEFASAISDVVEVHPEYRAIGPAALNGTLLRQDFRTAREQSIVALAVSRRRFVKVRLTALAEPVILAAAEESVVALQSHLRAN